MSLQFKYMKLIEFINPPFLDFVKSSLIAIFVAVILILQTSVLCDDFLA